MHCCDQLIQIISMTEWSYLLKFYQGHENAKNYCKDRKKTIAYQKNYSIPE